MKIYVLDTNVLLHNPLAIFAFEENRVVLPLAVIEEIDKLKKRQDEIGRNARQVSRELDGLRGQGRLAEGVLLPQGGSIQIEVNHRDLSEGVPDIFDLSMPDNRILGVAWRLVQEMPGPVILVTKDLNLRIKADVLGIPCEDFRNDQVDYHRLYQGVAELALSREDLDTFYSQGRLEMTNGHLVHPHQFLVLKCVESPSLSGLARFSGGRLWPLLHAEQECMGVRARNKEQRFALELLLDPEVKIVTLAGAAGTGKTLLALATGLAQTIEQKSYSKLLVTRPVVPMGNDLGYLPGEKEDKLRPWMQPIYDNLAYLFRNYPNTATGRAQKGFGAEEYLMSQGLLEMEALTYLRGRSIPGQFIICDEAQNLTPHMIKTLITRVGEGSKIVFTGDPEQIDHPYLDASSNGLTYLVERLKGEGITGHVTLVKGERSLVAELGAKLL